MQQIVLYGDKAAGRIALVDDEDYELVAQFRWNVYERTRQGAHSILRQGPYAFTNVKVQGKQKFTLMHKLITGWSMTDHINRNGLDNQRKNLRPTDKSLNAANQHPRTGGTSKYKGVYLSSKGLWIARVKENGKRVYLGAFPEEIDAARAYDRKMTEIFGPHALLNLPPG